MTKPTDYNQREMDAGRLTAEHIVELVRHFQRAHGLVDDGMAGPRTRAALEHEQIALRVVEGWLDGHGVTCVRTDRSWFGGYIKPLAIVAHYTATDWGTALSMATRRQRSRTVHDRATSWHITIAADGEVIQMAHLNLEAWHVASPDPIARGLPKANRCAIGIELEGNGVAFPAAQVAAAKRVWRALVSAFKIPRDLAMIEHSALQANRSDPGPVWMRNHASDVLDHAFA